MVIDIQDASNKMQIKKSIISTYNLELYILPENREQCLKFKYVAVS